MAWRSLMSNFENISQNFKRLAAQLAQAKQIPKTISEIQQVLQGAPMDEIKPDESEEGRDLCVSLAKAMEGLDATDPMLLASDIQNTLAELQENESYRSLIKKNTEFLADFIKKMAEQNDINSNFKLPDHIIKTKEELYLIDSQLTAKKGFFTRFQKEDPMLELMKLDRSIFNTHQMLNLDNEEGSKLINKFLKKLSRLTSDQKIKFYNHQTAVCAQKIYHELDNLLDMEKLDANNPADRSRFHSEIKAMKNLVGGDFTDDERVKEAAERVFVREELAVKNQVKSLIKEYLRYHNLLAMVRAEDELDCFGIQEKFRINQDSKIQDMGLSGDLDFGDNVNLSSLLEKLDLEKASRLLGPELQKKVNDKFAK